MLEGALPECGNAVGFNDARNALDTNKQESS